MSPHSTSPTDMPASIPTPAAVAHQLRRQAAAPLRALDATIHHPRSLARSTPTWRPPTITLPGFQGTGTLRATVHRHRVGPHAARSIHAYSGIRPAWLITVLLSSPRGRRPDPAIAEAWVRALVPDDLADAIHQPLSATAPTFCWVTDATFCAVHSPAELLSAFPQAA